MDELFEQKCNTCPYASEENCFYCIRQLRRKMNDGKNRRKNEESSYTETMYEVYDIPKYVYSDVS